VRPEYICSNLKRRQEVLRNPAVNGIDFLEVLDQEAAAIGSPRQQTLVVHCLEPPPPLTVQNLRIEGGVRITPVNVLWAFPALAVPSPPATPPEQTFFQALPGADHIMVLRTDVAGDFSTYTLRVVQSPSNPAPPGTFDSRFAAIEFSFKVECPSDFDCQTVPVCPPQSRPDAPQIDYLAKDYSSFRRLILDRLAVTMPAWQEESPADLGMALVEVLAYAADHTSYFQDAVATEAYLGTARKRVSVRRHVRLLDYAMHDGSNARAWVHIAVKSGSSADGATLPGPPDTKLLTRVNAPRGALSSDQMQTAITQGAIVFETLYSIHLFAAHNEMPFYTWGDDQCWLPKGATEATLRDDNRGIGQSLGQRLAEQQAGKAGPVVLLFEEVLSPHTGVAADADPAHRWAVRLTTVTPGTDSLTATPVVDIAWGADDALPFPLCISAAGVDGNVGVARGNIVLADHGLTGVGEALPFAAGRFRPRLQKTGITFSTPYESTLPAARSLVQDPRAAMPAVTLLDANEKKWTALPDLLGAGPFDRNFVVETEDDGTATLRFGDGVLGAAPATDLKATYRTGNGSAGHVGSEAIAHVVTVPALVGIEGVCNPLPSQGGIDPEPDAQVRLYAPEAFRTQARAVTEEDYAAAAGQHPQVEKAEATLRSTGTWHTMFVTVQRRGGQPVDRAFRADVRRFLEAFRLAGFDLEIEAPIFVPLDIAFTVEVAPGYFQSDVEEALLDTFSNRDLPDGRRGFFHPDRFTFGQPVYLSQIVAAAMRVPGVAWVDTSKTPPNHFQRFGESPHGELEAGRIPMARLEIARLDNDPNEPENGRIEFFLEGGL
jgi:hypothetical protein